MAIKHSESEQSVLEDMQHIACKRKEMEAVNSEELTDSTKTAEVLEKGFMQYG